MRRRTAGTLLLALALALPAAAAGRSGWHRVIRDCAADGRLDGHYARAQLERARDNLPTDVDRHTDCRQVIRAALGAGGHKHRDHHLALYPAGVAPVSATAPRTIDGDVKTGWSTRRKGRGVRVEPGPGTYGAIAVITDTPGWTLEVYWSNADSPGHRLSGDWNQSAFVNPASRRNRFVVPSAKHYLVWVAGTAGRRVRVNEIQLLGG